MYPGSVSLFSVSLSIYFPQDRFLISIESSCRADSLTVNSQLPTCSASLVLGVLNPRHGYPFLV